MRGLARRRRVLEVRGAMETAIFEIGSESETGALGRALAALLRSGDVVGLCGDLGAGKTALARAVARGLGVPERVPVTSPTFTLVNEHVGRLPVYHMDLYRLCDARELYGLGLWEYYGGEGVCLVEWCDRFEDLWPQDALVLVIHLGEGEARRIEARGEGRGAALVRDLDRSWRKRG
jgi:tRNA threonylcarbamoyladenosine biosynthesis protein TsaE